MLETEYLALLAKINLLIANRASYPKYQATELEKLRGNLVRQYEVFRHAMGEIA